VHEVLLDISTQSLRVEAYCNSALIHPDLQALLSEKNALHHALLCLPTASELALPERECGLYECYRLGALLYSSAVLYPLPPSTGTLTRLVAMAKQAVSDMRINTCFEGGREALIWILLLGGIAVEGSLEKVWFLTRLKTALRMVRVTRWSDLKRLVRAFLWMDAACDDGAFEGLGGIEEAAVSLKGFCI